MSQILVQAFAPGTEQAAIKCQSTADFLVYCSTNYFVPGDAPPSWGYGVEVQSTGAGIGTAAPMFVVGGIANDVVTISMQPGTTAFVTLQTRCDAKASIEAA